MNLGEALRLKDGIDKVLQHYGEEYARRDLRALWKEHKRVRRVKLSAPMSMRKLKGIVGFGGRGVTGRLRNAVAQVNEQRIELIERGKMLEESGRSGMLYVRMFRYSTLVAIGLGIALILVLS